MSKNIIVLSRQLLFIDNSNLGLSRHVSLKALLKLHSINNNFIHFSFIHSSSVEHVVVRSVKGYKNIVKNI